MQSVWLPDAGRKHGVLLLKLNSSIQRDKNARFFFENAHNRGIIKKVDTLRELYTGGTTC